MKLLTESPGHLAPRVATDPAAEAALEPPRARTLWDVFSSAAAAHPAAVALEADDATLTYAELCGAAQALAARLAHTGVRRGDRVAVRLPSGTSELYVAILGTLAAGAAYVPIDADDPPARAADILSRSRAVARIGAGLEIQDIGVDPLARLDDAGPARPASTPPALDDDAWIIFTSGSTGAPKGVAVTHRSAAAFVDAEARLWRVRPGDRVLAGLSVGFDASCEEIWLAWGHGATLVPAPRDLVRAGVELGDWLLARRISVVSTVPTLAALWDESCLHGVRLLILGGEACPEPLGWRLAAGREVWNTYGPTEATVVSTAAPIIPGAPIRIGRPLAGWDVAVMEGAEPVAPGTPGELVIGGVGLGRYLDPALDAERYAPIAALGWERAYRTGDIVIQRPEGLEFVGRRDDQVKVGGRRIELGEIEAALCAVAGVRAAAVTLRQSDAGNTLLVGYVVGGVDPAEVRAVVARSLPSGIVPLVVVMDELPLAPSGKVDRKALPWPAGGDAPGLTMGIGSDGEPLSDLQARLAECWVQQLGPVKISLDSDFFALGGASLAAAKLISVLRRTHPAVAVADVYRHPTLRAMSARLEALTASVQDADSGAAFVPRRGFQVGQLVGVLALFGLEAVPFLLATFVYGDIFGGLPRVAWVWLIAAYVLLASAPARVAVHMAATRLLMRGIAPGRHRRDSWVAWRLWFLSRLGETARVERVAGTPFAARYARLIGARVGAGARLASLPEEGQNLDVGPGATIEGGVDLRGWWIDSDALVIGSVQIGAGARVGSRSLLSPGAVIGAGAEIEAGSVVNGEVPAGERWGGVPAVKLGRAGEEWPRHTATLRSEPRRSGQRRWLFAGALLLQDALMGLAAGPGVLVLWLIGGFVPTVHSSLAGTLAEALIDVALWIPSFAILVALTQRAVGRLIQPGYHPDDGLIGWALWFSEQLRESAATTLFPLYASLFTRAWLRLSGLSIGRGSEISTATGMNRLVSLGEYCQSTDDIGFCGVRSRNGWIHAESISVGDRSFLGPGSVLRGGTALGPDSLLGVLTLSPRDPAPATSWLGVPALELPRVAASVDPARTVSPPRRLIAARGAMDIVRLLVPNLLSALIALLELELLARLADGLGVFVAILAAPALLFAGGIVAMLCTVAIKWLVMGRYRPSEHPLWSWFVWRDELLNAAQEQLAVERLLNVALGTPLMGLYLRLMGARVGRGAWVETTAFTEYEMIELGPGAVANRGSCLMTHLFHDRLLRIGPTRLGPGACLGPVAAVLPDTVLGAGTVLGGHSVVLRGEELPEHTRWHGTPVVPA